MAKAKEPAPVYQLKITLKGVRPPIWRRVHVKDCSLAKLHKVIQLCMSWTDSHMHVFEVGGQEYGAPDPTGEMEYLDEARVKLSQVVAQGHKRFVYVYDFGDNWDHTIEVEKTLPAEPGARYLRCVAGKRACPPEDCGGPWGYPDFLAAIQNPGHPEHEEMLEWSGGEFDPVEFDIEAINENLGAIR